MAQRNINIGAANQGNGDTLFDAFTKVQENFTELYTDDTGDVDSVNGQTGTVVLDSDDISDAGKTNQWDKTVTLSEGDNVTITGTYPNFTIASNDVVGAVSSVSGGDSISVNSTTGAVIVTNDAPNYNHTGEVTGATELTIASNVITQDKLANQFKTTLTNGSATGSVSLDFGAYQVFDMTLSGTTTFGITNAEIGMVKDLYVTGVQTFSITNGKSVAGTYDGSVVNLIQIVAQTPTSFWYSISQEQV